MKRHTKKPIIWVLIVLIIIIGLVAFRPLIVSATSGLLAPPVPTPFVGNGPKNEHTATPDLTQVAKNRMVTPAFIAPLPTKIVISKITNLSPELDINDEYSFVISHKDGTNEEILFGPVPQGDISLNVPDDVLKKLNLQPGDKIISKTNNKAIMVGHATLAPTAVETLMPTNTPEINPTSTIQAYP